LLIFFLPLITQITLIGQIDAADPALSTLVGSGLQP
jgi:hypothetical protein